MTTSMNLEGIMDSEINQTEKEKYCMGLHIYITFKITWKQTHKKQEIVGTRGEGCGDG